MVAIGATLALTFGANAAVAAPKRPAMFRESPGAYFNADAYPPAALRAGEQGRVVARLEIDDTGRVVSCTVTTSSGSASLDQTTCRIALDRISFTPAADRRGRAIASTYILPVRWVLPTGDRFVERMRPVEIAIEQVVDADGQRRSCTFEVNGVQQTTPDTCDQAGRIVPEALARLPAELKGKPVVLTQIIRHDYAGASTFPAIDKSATLTLDETVVQFTVQPDGKAVDCQRNGVAVPDAAPCGGPLRFHDEHDALPAHPLPGIWTFVVLVRALPAAPGV